MSVSKFDRPCIGDYVGIILSKYSYYYLIKIGKKRYEIKFMECLDLPPYAIFHPGRSFRKAVMHKNLVTKISKPIGPFHDAQSAWNYVGHGMVFGIQISHRHEMMNENENRQKTTFDYPRDA